MYPRTPASHYEWLAASDGQRIYWEQTGNPDGIPVVFCHGGPGSGLGHRGYVTRLNPARFRIIGFDQRGCGRSSPMAIDTTCDWETQTIGRLIADMEELRQSLGIERWLLNGVSWGSTLALAYAQAHPENVLGVVLMAVTTTSRAEVDWITDSVSAIYPEYWQQFADYAAEHLGWRPQSERLVEAYARGLRDQNLRDEASWAWARWEQSHISLVTGGPQPDPRWDDDQFRINFAALTSQSILRP